MIQRRDNMKINGVFVGQVRSNSIEPKQESMREIKKHLKEAEDWFKVLVRHCDYYVDCLCHIPLDIHPVEGPIVCTLKNCPLVNKEVCGE
jgi:hypothetical protein